MIDIIQQIIDLSKKYISQKEALEMNLSHIDYGEYIVAFDALCSIILTEEIKVSDEDKKVITEIGEGLFKSTKYGASALGSKPWEKISSL